MLLSFTLGLGISIFFFLDPSLVCLFFFCVILLLDTLDGVDNPHARSHFMEARLNISNILMRDGSLRCFRSSFPVGGGRSAR